MKLYVASSWRNPYQQNTVAVLRQLGHEVYDFRHPRGEGSDGVGGDHLGFSWSDVDPNWRGWRADQYVAALEHPIAVAGFESDFAAMQWAEACVLLLPCGRSAHLEAGWFAGADKPLFILLDRKEFAGDGSDQTSATELMYRMAYGVFYALPDLIKALDRPACLSCRDTRWVDDQNWTPEDPRSWDGKRRPHDGRIPCGACNDGGWDVDDGVAA